MIGFIRCMQKVMVQTSLERFRQYYGSDENLPDRTYLLSLPDQESSMSPEVKTLEPTKWPARATRFEVHKVDEVIVTFDQPVVIIVKNQCADFAEAFVIEPFTKVTIRSGILHGWVFALSGKTKILVVYPMEKEELLYQGEYDAPTVVLPEELGVEQGEIPACIW